MLTEIAATIGAIKTARDLLQSTTHKGDTPDVNAALMEASDQVVKLLVLASQTEQDLASARQAMTDKDAEIQRLIDWKAEAECYQLTELVPGIFAFVPKPGAKDSEPKHSLCANCFTKGQKSYLQRVKRVSGNWCMECHNCNSNLPSLGFMPVPKAAQQP